MQTFRALLLLSTGLLGVALMTACSNLSPRAVLRLEAEDAHLHGLQVATATPGFSGRGYVTGFDQDDDRMELTFQAAAGLCELHFRYHTPFGAKGYAITVNGIAGAGMLAASGPGFAVQPAGRFLLKDGENTLVMGKGWGWFEIDAFDLIPTAPMPPASVQTALADPRATPAARRLHAYLLELYGRKTLAGQQDFGNLRWIAEQTGREPAVAALDLMDYSPSRVERGTKPEGSTETAIEWVRSGGGILTYCWHWNAPTDLLDQPGGKEWYKGFYTKATTFDIAAVLVDPAGDRYRLLLRDIDAIAGELRKFADADIPVLWRPLHEAQGAWFWWGAKGPQPFVDLWRLLYQRLTEHHALHHLIWVYSPPGNGIAALDWYPGDAYVDVIAPGIYAGRRPSMSAEWEAAQAAYGGRKLVALGECGDPPNPAIMRGFGTRWSWFATWSGPFIRDVPAEQLRTVFLDEDVITRDELPAWTRPSAPASPRATHVPAPRPVDTGGRRIGAIFCPLWQGGTRWHTIVPYPDRQPLLGWYDEGDPEVTDWEITWALDHGISFFLICWYRQAGNLGRTPVEPALGHWLHQGLPQSRYGAKMDFAILWENGHASFAGVAQREDLLGNLLPFWVDAYFRRPNYLVLDGKPVLAIYSVKRFVEDLGGEDAAADVIERLRTACREAGFAGLHVLGQYCWGDLPSLTRQAEQIQRIGMDCSWAYHWPTFTGAFGAELRPSGAEAIAAQVHLWQSLPQPGLLTLSMGWDSQPWGFSCTRAQWRLSPAEFEVLCRQASDVLRSRPVGGLESRLLLLDNWNEFGEGHYLLPARQYGFGYLDAVRTVFAPGAPPHQDVTPADLGLGPYDSQYRASLTAGPPAAGGP